MFLNLILLSILAIFPSSPADGHVLDEVPLVDGHNDLPWNIHNKLHNDLSTFHFDKNLTTDPVWGKANCNSCFTDLPRLRAGKVGSQFWVAYVHCVFRYKDALAKTFEQIDLIKRLVKKYPNDLQLVTTSDGIMDAFKNKKIGSLIGVEGGHLIDSRLAILRMFYDLGVRYLTLTHICNTPWADNSYVDDTAPVHNLTDFGKLVVKEMNRIGMMVDLSHVSHGVMNEAIRTSRAPVMFSHSSAYSVFAHNRNVRDGTLQLVKENNGVVMVNFYHGILRADSENSTIDDVVAHINHIARVAGVDHVGLGSDFDGVRAAPKGLEDVSKYPDLIDRLEASNPKLWTKENLKKVAGLNLIRVFANVEKVRDSLVDEEPYQSWIPTEDLNADGGEIWRCRTLLSQMGSKP